MSVSVVHLLSTAPLCWACSIYQGYVTDLDLQIPLLKRAEQCFNHAHLFSTLQNQILYINNLYFLFYKNHSEKNGLQLFSSGVYVTLTVALSL